MHVFVLIKYGNHTITLWWATNGTKCNLFNNDRICIKKAAVV